jgi:rhamnose utilization protein RhaD (predicted bifunctional aldolase and dehydrogenase)
MIQNFIETSYILGSNPILVQGAGGNTSYKQHGFMWIKASGKCLSNAHKENIFTKVDHNIIKSNIKSNHKDPLNKSMLDSNGLRPSIETTLHALMPQRFVFHTHPVELLAWIVCKDAELNLNNLFDKLNWKWVPYARPGFDLTKQVLQATDNKVIDILVLGNHGLVVGGDSCEQVLSLMDEALSRCRTNLVSQIYFDDQSLINTATKLGLYLPDDYLIQQLAFNEVIYEHCSSSSGMLYPDQAVFLSGNMNCYKDISEVMKLLNSEKKLPSFFIIKNEGVFITKGIKTDIEEMLKLHVEVLMRVDSNSELQYLSELEVSNLLEWEAEKYRQTLHGGQ